MRVSAMVVFTRNLKQGGENARAGNRLSLNARVVRTRRGHLFGGGGGREQCREENQEQHEATLGERGVKTDIGTTAKSNELDIPGQIGVSYSP